MFMDEALAVYTIADRRAGVVPGWGVFCGCAATYLRQPQARQIEILIRQQFIHDPVTPLPRTRVHLPGSAVFRYS